MIIISIIIIILIIIILVTILKQVGRLLGYSGANVSGEAEGAMAAITGYEVVIAILFIIMIMCMTMGAITGYKVMMTMILTTVMMLISQVVAGFY